MQIVAGRSVGLMTMVLALDAQVTLTLGVGSRPEFAGGKKRAGSVHQGQIVILCESAPPYAPLDRPSVDSAHDAIQ